MRAREFTKKINESLSEGDQGWDDPQYDRQPPERDEDWEYERYRQQEIDDAYENAMTDLKDLIIKYYQKYPKRDELKNFVSGEFRAIHPEINPREVSSAFDHLYRRLVIRGVPNDVRVGLNYSRDSQRREKLSVVEGFADDLDNIYAVHPQPEKSEQVVFLITGMTEYEFSNRWTALPDSYQQEFGYDLPLWDADDLSHYPNLAVKRITFDKYVQIVGNYIKSEEIGGSALSKMKRGVAEGQITEASKDFAERHYAGKEIDNLLRNLEREKSPNVTPEIIKKMKELVAITGRGHEIPYFGSAGSMLDKLVDMYRQSQIRSGQMPQFTGRATTARDMARQIANQTRGTYRYFEPQSWATRSGQRYRDPADYVVYPDQESYDDAVEWIKNKGKKVRYQDHFGHLNTATKIGRYIVEPSTFTQGAFSDDPRTTHRISVRLAKTINQGGRQQVDISDQQAAALHDIAATRDASAMSTVQSIMAVLKGMEDVKRVIANSKKIDPRDKAKLDAIISAAGKQGVAEGSDNNVYFEVDSENAYNHVMKKFGSVIKWDGDTMIAPRKYWGAIQELAYSAGGEATEVGDEQVVAEGSRQIPGDQVRGDEPAKASGRRHPFQGRLVGEDLRDPEDNPCWKGYHPVGTKKKNGRTVPNCVPNAKKK